MVRHRVIALAVVLSIPNVATSQSSRSGPSVELLMTLPGNIDHYFGRITDLDAFADGSVVVLDDLSHHIDIFSPTGELIHTIGREGGGPGEIGGANEIEITPDGSIVLIDYRYQRSTRWSQDGTLEGTNRLPTMAEAGWPHELFWTGDGPLLKVSSFVPNQPVLFLRMANDLQSVVDTMAIVSDSTTTCLFCPWAVGPNGRIWVAAGDTLYRLHQIDDRGNVTARLARDDLPATRRTPEELDQLSQALSARSGAEGGGARKAPPFRNRFERGSLATDGQGRMWALPTHLAQQTTDVDVFDPRSSRRETVRLPGVVNLIAIRHGLLLAGGENADAEPIVQVFRIRS